MATVLIVDDDVKLLKMLQRTLTYEGLLVITASNGVEALKQVDAYHPEIIILDWMMPKMDGMEVMRQLRSENNRASILMLTARDAIENRVEGLESGADDYLIKPFAPPELVARVHALLRRIENKTDKRPVSFAGLHLDPTAHLATLDGAALELTPTEFDLLHYFMRHPRQVLERAQILTNVWGYDFGGEQNVLEVYVGYLRKKLEANGHPRLIQTVRGIGYALRVE
ncbi:MAG: response regulator transcription factor [Chloroflexi bacterium]|nr:DNA-binding response regulator [Anaerolinea sp.]TDA66635.1 MAG: response regulator transcription factor [Chloroflexota bacterium]